MTNPDAHHHHSCQHHADAKPAQSDDAYDKVPADYAGTVWTCPMHPQVREMRTAVQN
ncbi:hypothetical protein [Henriciella aquimarina]|uniref:hypothetical protein n=1 Tax=Henriciella aquimarina TaxID=545261 RepID=UPI001301B927|nr:hypothetical protein [Henriciella aquimarina]